MNTYISHVKGHLEVSPLGLAKAMKNLGKSHLGGFSPKKSTVFSFTKISVVLEDIMR